MTPKIIARDKKHLEKLILKKIKLKGNKCDLNYINVSKVEDMSFLFFNSEFNGDISQWDVGNVKNMESMFERAKFNGDISKWNVSKVNDMYEMFKNGEFNRDLTIWKPYSLITTYDMFLGTQTTTPYWAEYEGQANRKRAIDAYWLNQELNVNEQQKKKIKI